MLSFIDTRLQQLAGTKAVFGGLSIIAVGDLYQLKPVNDKLICLDLETGDQNESVFNRCRLCFASRFNPVMHCCALYKDGLTYRQTNGQLWLIGSMQ